MAARWLVVMCAMAWSSLVRAQAIEVVGRDTCITERALTAALKRYAKHLEPDPSLEARVRLADQALSFEVLRDGEVLADREFDTVPRRCVERVRAVAIAIALAFESVREREREQLAAAAPSTGSPAEPSAGAAATSTPATPTKPPPAAEQPAAPQDKTAKPPEVAEVKKAEPKPPAAKPPPEEPKEEEDADDEQDEPAEPQRRGEPVVVARAGAGVLIGVLPKPAPAFAVGAGIIFSRLVRLELTALMTTRVTSDLADGVVDAQLFGGECALCLGAPFGALRLAGCAGVAGGAVPAQGRDFSVSSRSTLTGWTAALLGTTMDVTLVGPLALRLSAELHGSWVQPVLEARVDGEDREATPFPLGTLLSAHVLWALP